MSNRKDIRHALGALFRLHVPAAQEVFDEPPGDLGSGSPLLVLESRGSARGRLTFQGGKAIFKFWLHIYTLAAETAAGNYTYADSANLIDDLEAQIADLVTANPARYEAFGYDGESTIEFGILNNDGIWRFRESIPLAITIFG